MESKRGALEELKSSLENTSTPLPNGKKLLKLYIDAKLNEHFAKVKLKQSVNIETDLRYNIIAINIDKCKFLEHS